MSQYDQPSFDPAKLRPYIFIGIIVVILIIVLSNIFVILQPTERGVIFKKYTSGLDVDDVKQEGLSIVAPWNDVIIFDIAERQVEETMDVLSKDGLSIAIDVSLRFRPEPSKIGYLYRAFKNSYIESLVRPELRSAVRQIIGQYTPEELYATKRQEIETRIQEAIRKVLDENHVELKALLFRSIKLPAMIKTAIEQKLTAEQESEKYEFLIQKEKKEAERRRNEAEGQAAANRILSASITSNILKEKGITATESLAKSNHPTIVVTGGGDEGLPIILSSDK